MYKHKQLHENLLWKKSCQHFNLNQGLFDHKKVNKIVNQTKYLTADSFQHSVPQTHFCWYQTSSDVQSPARAGGIAWDKPVKEIYESKDRGGGHAGEHDVTALPPQHISTVYSLHIPPWNRSLVLRIRSPPPARPLISASLYLSLSPSLLWPECCVCLCVCVWMRPHCLGWLAQPAVSSLCISSGVSLNMLD